MAAAAAAVAVAAAARAAKRPKTQSTDYTLLPDRRTGRRDRRTARAQNNVKPFQFLPSPDKPVLTYIGTARAATRPLFLVSKDVVSVGGDGTCFPTADACQLLGLNAGKGADLIYGPDGKTYHVQVRG